VSLIHHLTIGRFRYADDAQPPSMLQRVVAHVVPGGLRHLEWVTGTVDPFSDDELARLQDELLRRFGVEATLRDHLTPQGLLCIPYLGTGALRIAEHVALIAHGLFGAVAGERGELHALDALRRRSEAYVVEDAEGRRLAAIEDGAERVRDVVASLRRRGDDPRRIPVWMGVDVVADAGGAAVPELIAALSAQHDTVRRFAALALARLGRCAAEAIPALLAAAQRSTGDEAYGAVCALAAMGRAAEEGLVLALDHRNDIARFAAIEGLGRLGEVSAPTRARLVALEATKGHQAKLARIALSTLGRER
jgi:HEAT repeat protein